MKRLYILLFLAFPLCAQVTQETLITWGKTHKIAPFSQFFAEDAQYLYAYKVDFPNNLKHLNVIFLDKNELSMQEAALVLPKNKEEQFTFLHLLKTDNTLALFYQRFVENGKEVSLWMQPFTLEGNAMGRALLLDELPLLHPKDRSTYYQLGSTPNGEVMLANAISLKIEEKPGFFIKIFDKNFKKQREHFIPIPEQKADIIIDKMLLDLQGNSYVLAYELQRLPSVGQRLLPEVYKLFLVDKTGKTQEYHLDIQKKYLAATELLLQPQTHQVLITGFYANDKMAQFSGIFLLQMNEKGGIEKAHFTKIPPSFFANENKNNAHKNLQNYQLEAAFLQNGNLHLLVQQKFIEAVNRMSSFDVSYAQDIYYHFLNVGYFILNEEGELIASYKIPKRQVTMNDKGLFSGFIPLKRTRDNAHWISFLYLDNPKNKNSTHSAKVMSQPQSALWMETSVLESGRLQKRVLPNLGEKIDGLHILPQSYYQSGDYLYLLGVSKEGLQVGRLQVNLL